MTERRLGALRDVDRCLFEAVNKGDVVGLKSALSDGADVHAKDERGRTAMLCAMEGTHPDQPWPKYPKVVEALQEHMHKTATG